MADSKEVTVEEIEARHQALSSRATKVQQDKANVEAELNARKRSLKKTMDEVRAEGIDPASLDEEIRRLKTVLTLKLDNAEAELTESEKILRPMLIEIQSE